MVLTFYVKYLFFVLKWLAQQFLVRRVEWSIWFRGCSLVGNLSQPEKSPLWGIGPSHALHIHRTISCSELLQLLCSTKASEWRHHRPFWLRCCVVFLSRYRVLPNHLTAFNHWSPCSERCHSACCVLRNLDGRTSWTREMDSSCWRDWPLASSSRYFGELHDPHAPSSHMV
jgi:hypothetical protein